MLRKIKSIGGGLFRWEIEITVAGKRVHKTFPATQAAASEIYAKLADDKARADVGLPLKGETKAKPLAEAAREYESHLREIRRSAEHIEDVGYTLAGFCGQLPKKNVAELSRADINLWREWRGKQIWRGKLPSPRTINKALAEVSGFLSWCMDQEYTESNLAMRATKVTEIQQPPPAPVWEHYCKLVENLWRTRPAMALIVEAAADSGARIGELIAAKPGDVNAERQIWRKHVKGNRVVEVRAEPWILHALKHAGAYLFEESGQPWKYDKIHRVLLHRCRVLDIPHISPHDLRHGRATWDVESGHTPRQVQEKLAHTSIQITQRYFAGARALSADPNAVRTRKPGDFCGICGANRCAGPSRTDKDFSGLRKTSAPKLRGSRRRKAG